MPYVAPTCKWVGGNGGDSNRTSGGLGAGDACDFSVPVTAGDLVVVTVTTSDYLRTWASVSGASVPTWYASGGDYIDTSGYGDAQIRAGWANSSGTFTLSTTFSGGNAGANYQQVRISVWGGSDGYGGSAREHKTGNSDVYLPINRGASGAVWCAVDWNAASGQGTTQQQGGPGYLDDYFAGGAAHYWAGHNDNMPTGSFWVGNYSTGNSKVTTIAQEILGKWRDTTPPTVPGGVTAVADKQGRTTVSWSASTDSETNASGLKGYQVKRNGAVVADNLTTTSWVDTGAKLTDSYTVNAVDNAGNRSNDSAVASPAVPKFRMGAQPIYVAKAGSLNVDRIYLGSTRVYP